MSEQVTSLSLVPGSESVEGAGFETFFRDQRSKLFGSMLLITGDSHEAEELVQEAFFKVWERWDRVREMDNRVGYLYRTAMNNHRSAYRRTVRAARRVVSPPPETDPFVTVAARDAVLRALGTMTPRQRAAMVLTELHGSEPRRRPRCWASGPGRFACSSRRDEPP